MLTIGLSGEKPVTLYLITFKTAIADEVRERKRQEENEWVTEDVGRLI